MVAKIALNDLSTIFAIQFYDYAIIAIRFWMRKLWFHLKQVGTLYTLIVNYVYDFSLFMLYCCPRVFVDHHKHFHTIMAPCPYPLNMVDQSKIVIL